MKTRLAGFYRISGQDEFQGYLGSGQIEVPYARVRKFDIHAPAHPGGRMRAVLTLRSGNVVQATFDEREGDQLLTGYASFGRVSLFFRDIRQLTILGKTRRKDLPVYGPPTYGMDVRVKDRQGVETELVRFRRAGGENYLPAMRGAASVAVPMRIVSRLEFTGGGPQKLLRAAFSLKSGGTVRMRLPTYEEETVYSGKAEFGTFRISLGKIRELIVHRATPELHDLDPIEAAQGPKNPEDKRRR